MKIVKNNYGKYMEYLSINDYVHRKVKFCEQRVHFTDS